MVFQLLCYGKTSIIIIIIIISCRWMNYKDLSGNGLCSGGFLGMNNIGIITVPAVNIIVFICNFLYKEHFLLRITLKRQME